MTYYRDKGLTAESIDKDERQGKHLKWDWTSNGKLYNHGFDRSFGFDPRSGEYHPGAGDTASIFEPRRTSRRRSEFAEGWQTDFEDAPDSH